MQTTYLGLGRRCQVCNFVWKNTKKHFGRNYKWVVVGLTYSHGLFSADSLALEVDYTTHTCHFFKWPLFLFISWLFIYQRNFPINKCSTIRAVAVTQLFFLIGPTRPLFRLLLIFFKQISIQFYNKFNVKNVHPVYSAGIRTQEVQDIRLLP